ERVCDYVIMIDSGRLIATGYLSDLIETRQEIMLEIDGDNAAFTSALLQRGVAATAQDGRLSIGFESESIFDAIRDSAVESETAIRHLATRRTSLEEFYIDIVESNEQGTGSNQ